MATTTKKIERSGEKLADSAEKLEHSTERVEDSADRRTQLAADRTVFAAERTYAAWVHTGLVSLASGIGAQKLLEGSYPGGSSALPAACFWHSQRSVLS